MRSIQLVLSVSIFLSALLNAPPANAQSAGDSVNMVSGTGWTNGDPFLQRQNEPSLAVSTRNTLHLLGGANDYRSVDIAGLAGQSERADAWLGLFKSFDGGQTWQSTLLPGFPLDSSPAGIASPLHGFQAAADPTVRAGTNGLFFYSGIAFNRGTNAPGVVFVARFIDNDNKENGDATRTAGSLTNLAPTDPIEYLGTVLVDSGNSGQFLDKPWIATDIPRGTATCSVPYPKSDGTQGTQTIPAGKVYLAYTSFNGNQQSTRIMFTTSTDCGTTWNKPIKVSESNSVNQGTIVVVDPSSANSGMATIYIAWRRFATSSQPDAMEIVKSSDGGNTFTKSFDAVLFPASCTTTLPPNPPPAGCPFDQGTTAASFRTSAFPALTVDNTGRVYLGWSQRQASGDARIMMKVSPDGANWSSTPALVDNGTALDDSGNSYSNLSGRGHQLMPSLSFSAGKVSMAYFDFREDHSLGFFTVNPDLSSYTESRQLAGELTGDPASSLVFNSFVSDAAPPLTTRRHTVDVQGAQASPLPSGSTAVPSFTPFQISRYLFGINPFDASNQAEQLQVDVPDLPMFEQGTVPFFGDYIDIAPAPSFLFQNGKWIFNTSSANLPVFHAVWTDNRDVVPPSDGNWTHYEPPFSASNPAGSKNASVFDSTQTVTACQIGVNDGFVASRNQNIYTSIVAPGLAVGSLGNSKPLGFSAANPTQLLQRAFTVTLRNTTAQQRTFRISIANQPALANGQPDPQGQASLLQFSMQTSLDVTISPQSSIARAVFIQSANPSASVTVNAQEISAPGGTLVSGGLQGILTFNPDPAAPLLLDPDNFGFANPAVLSAETHNPAIANPAIANPAIANPAIANPAIANPAIANPAIANPAIANQSVTDATYPVTNAGNTTTSYAVKLFQKAPLPAGVNLQLILTKQSLVPVAQGCDLKQQIQNIVVASIPNPVFTPAGSLGDPNLPDASVTNATIALNPGETGQLIIRANVSDPAVMQNLLSNILVPVAVAHPANTGVAIPSATLAILSSTLPDGVVGATYNGQLNIFGGFGARTVSISSSTLPTGLSLDPNSGLISGTPTSTGSFPFTVQVTDSFTPAATGTQAVTLLIASPLLITAPAGADGIVNAPYSLSLGSTGGSGNQTWKLASGMLPSGLNMSTAGVISGIPSQVNSAGSSVTIQVQDSSNPPQITTVSLTIHIAPVLAVSTAQGPLPDAIVGQTYSFTFQSSGGLTPITWSLTGGSLPAGLTLSPSGTINGTPTAGGSFSFTVQAGDGSSPAQTITINVSVRSAAQLVISTPGGALPDAVVGVSYSPITLQSAGGIAPQVWSIRAGALPPGMGLNSAGVIGGVPSATGTFAFTTGTKDASNPTQLATISLGIRVAAPLTITTPAGLLPDALYKTAYNQTLTTSGGNAPIAWSLSGGQLPPGLTLSSVGVIGGTATATGTYSFTVKATDGSSPQQSTTVSFTLSVASTLSIVFTVQPNDTSSASSQITPAVKVLVTDNLGHSPSGATVQMSLASNATGASLLGQTIITIGNNGIAIFSSLGVNKTGKGYTLKALVTSPQNGASAISVPFNVQ